MTCKLIPHADRSAGLPLSFGQQRLWLVEQLAPRSALYNEPLVVLELDGPLDEAALQLSLDHLVARHEPLRSRFVSREGEVVAWIDEPGPARLVRIDLSDSDLNGWLDREAMRAFDLSSGPLFRATLIRRDGDRSGTRHILVLGLHHTVSDGWSVRLLLADIAALYSAAARGDPMDLALPPLSVQYGDYAVWQRERYCAGDFAVDESYWLSHLRRAARTHWQPDRTGMRSSHFEANMVATELPLKALDTVRGALASISLGKASETGFTRYMVMLAAWAMVVQSRVIARALTVATAVAGRSSPELEPLIGFFVNVLALHIDMSGNPSFGELASRVRECVLGALAHQALPFDCLIERLAPERSEARQPLTNVFFAYHNFPALSIGLGDVNVRRYRHERGGAKYDVALLVVEHEESNESASLQLWYDRELFKEEAMRDVLDELRCLIEVLSDGNVDRRLLGLAAITHQGSDIW